MKKVQRLRESFDQEAAAISDVLAICDSLGWHSAIRVLLFVLSRYWPNGWRAALGAEGSGLH